DCSLNTPPLVCDDWSGADPVCVNGTGDSCDDIYSIGVLSPPFVGSGSDFMADYANDHEFSDLEGCGNASGAEAVFSVYLAQYETLSMKETGSFDAVWRVLEMCDDTAGACLLSADDGTNDEAVFLAMEEGYYYVILESYSSNPADVDYDFSIALRAPESDCGNGADDDGDSYADCEDPDCFGDATNCTDEVGLCDDAFDNDNDGLTDCFDADDCGGVPACNLRLGPWEEFGSYTIVATDYYYPVDLTNCHLVYTPQTVWPHGYDVVSWCNCEAPAWVIAPTGGVAVSLGDDDHTALVATSFPDFNFFGTTYAEVIVESNGWLSFDGAASDVPISDEGGFFSLPIIAGVAGNLDPSSGGSISYHDTVSAFVVTFEDVPYHGQTETVSFQIILNADETIEVYFLSTEMLDEGKNVFTGLSNGVNNDTPPPEDFVIPGPGVGDVIITEFMFNPNVVDDAAGEYIELYNRSPRAINLGCCELHDNTGDLALNEIIDEHAYAVYVRNANPLENGGIEGGYEMGTAIQISDGAPENLSLTCYADNTVIDILPFDTESSWPGGGVGISAQLSTMSYDAELNDDITHWCDASEAYGAGDLGSPGEL
ncbi:MAG: lamin tail domain-containing protein, partial [Lentisphaeria bacterium]|nr:lamin tail domain-containing protein [Lentisphaeria bacterium]